MFPHRKAAVMKLSPFCLSHVGPRCALTSDSPMPMPFDARLSTLLAFLRETPGALHPFQRHFSRTIFTPRFIAPHSSVGFENFRTTAFTRENLTGTSFTRIFNAPIGQILGVLVRDEIGAASHLLLSFVPGGRKYNSSCRINAYSDPGPHPAFLSTASSPSSSTFASLV